MLSSEAGSKLNAEVVARFLEAFPALPLGTEVRVVGGEHDGGRAIVSRPGLGMQPRPRVRVYADRTGVMHTPVELDLARVPGVKVRLDESLAA